MQVFVPYSDIKLCVQCLDSKRLGNQIWRECLTIARGRWPNHPISKMWIHHTYFLCEYAFAGLDELAHRGSFYPDTFDKFHEIQLQCRDTGPPSWWGDEQIHNSHKQVLLYKNPEHYKQFGWNLPPRHNTIIVEVNPVEEIMRINRLARKERGSITK